MTACIPLPLPLAVSPPLPREFTELRWYAAYTCPRHEKRVMEQLQRKSVESFLPLFGTVRRWKNGPARVQLPLFPGYVFTRIALRDRLQILELPGVVRLVGFNGLPAALPDEQIEGLRNALGNRSRVEPHPYLPVGLRVRILRGPFAGLEGILRRRKTSLRVVVSIELIRRAVSLEIEECDLGPPLLDSARIDSRARADRDCSASSGPRLS
jgi:transcription antitermination factor NusG